MNKLLNIILTITVLGLVGCITEPETTTMSEPQVVSSSVDGSSSSSLNSSSSVTDTVPDRDWAALIGTVVVFNDTQYVYDSVAGRLDQVINNPCTKIDTAWAVMIPEYVTNWFDSVSNHEDSIGRLYGNADFVSGITEDKNDIEVMHCAVSGYDNVVIETNRSTEDIEATNISVTPNKVTNVIVDGIPLNQTIDPEMDELLKFYFGIRVPGFYPCTTSPLCTP